MAYSAFDLSGKTVVITGGNGGIGLGMARALVDSGANVVLWGRNSSKNEQAVSELQAREKGIQNSGEVISQVVDVADQTAVHQAMNEAANHFGGIDSVIANAGIGSASTSFFDITDEDYRKVMAVNLDGVFYTLRAAAKHMVDQNRGGSMMVVSSLGATEGMPSKQHYAATKGAVISMMNACAVEFARNQIRCNAILPGFVDTELTSGYLHSEVHSEKVLKRVPLRRWGRPDDYGGIAVYLASDASKYQTGSTTIIDGGFSVF